MQRDEYIRKATVEDLPVMLAIVECARRGLASRKVPQWQNGQGPSESVLRKDISDGRAYVLIASPPDPKTASSAALAPVLLTTCIAAMGILTFTEDAAYEKLESWPHYAESPYASIHRLTVNPRFSGRGYGTLTIQLLTSLCSALGFCDVRIDTHPRNAVMRKTVERVGYQCKGDIVLPVADGERLAYQRILAHSSRSSHL